MASSILNSGNGYNFKVVLLGEGCVGKTSVALRYVEDKFNDKHLTTVQARYYFYNLLSLFYYLSIIYIFYFSGVIS